MRLTRNTLIAFGLLALLISTPGFSGEKRQIKKRLEKLNEDVDLYNRMIRWGDYLRAANFLEQTDASILAIDPAGLKNIRVTDFEVKEKILGSNNLDAAVLIEFRYFNEYSGRERLYLDRQYWVYNPEKKSWFLRGDLPAFGTALRPRTDPALP